MKITKAVLPVAGAGTRFLPATKVIPKELLPVGDKPVIQLLVEEAVKSGIEEIVFVIAAGKELIREHFTRKPELEALLSKRGKTDLLKKVLPLHEMARFRYVYQDQPLGDGHAILQAENEVKGEPFLVLFGDDLVRGPVPAARQLMERFSGETVIAVERIAREKTGQYGIIVPGKAEGRLHEVRGLVEKPDPAKAPSDLGVIGKYVCTPAIFDAIRGARPSKGGELRLIDGFMRLLSSEKIRAYEVEGERFDTGYPEGLLAAGRAFFDGGDMV